jgi:hypothetical protein
MVGSSAAAATPANAIAASNALLHKSFLDMSSLRQFGF